MRYTKKLLPSVSGRVGVFTLNNPRPLHALTLDMLHCFQDVLQQWLYEPNGGGGGRPVNCILMKSNSMETKVPAFCAGGNVKKVYYAGIEEEGGEETIGQGVPGLSTSEFFRQEYIVDYALASHHDVLPQVSLWDGIVMGGGVGISINGRYRVATENTVLAMPETAIGLFPDVGTMYWMPSKLSPSLSSYIGLTGYRLKAKDLLRLGLATHFVPSNQLDQLEKVIVEASTATPPTTGEDYVLPILNNFHQDPTAWSSPDSSKATELEENMEYIDDAFGKEESLVSLESILLSLEELDNDFGKRTLQTMSKMSPTSMKVTLEGLRRGRSALLLEAGEDEQTRTAFKRRLLADNFRMEYRMAQSFMRRGMKGSVTNGDFYEGIRSTLIDKDGNPQWNPTAVSDVSDDMVRSYFDPIQHEFELPDWIVQYEKRVDSVVQEDPSTESKL